MLNPLNQRINRLYRKTRSRKQMLQAIHKRLLLYSKRPRVAGRGAAASQVEALKSELH